MVQNYIAKGLLGFREDEGRENVRDNLLYFLAGVVFVSILPYLHIGVFDKLVYAAKPKVNRSTYTCNCFDTIFRGPYEYPPSGYKHLYFNATLNSMKIWITTVIFILALNETLKYLLKLWRHQKLRKKMFCLVAMTTYPHYYAWWVYLTYYNEEFYLQWSHQTVFTITEIISTLLVLNLCNTENPMSLWKLLFIININTAHLITGGFDQFYRQLVSTGYIWQNSRNIGLMVPDIFHILICLFEIRRLAKEKKVWSYELFYKEEYMLSFSLILVFYVLTSI
ncbi:unnamed protein product, partial [Owenia fusiformis]